ncbi:hypothetical protein [Gluconobacter albidus]|uniref:hypothetical protein n=1 Tax=Gluconobacter albidus TaxID=318683 RepID=UPI001B8BDAB8|nr:hypothetical protein [Gluconobacter albidus]MBS1029097.1 hypothetical protein [Gluconobacter albidus]
MHKSVIVHVDAPSWGARPVPTQFISEDFVFNIGEVLLTIGIITSPPRATGFTLSEYWAWVRYLCAVSGNSNELCLVPEYKNIDSHQKTILSDDFGMGFSMYWMWKKLNFSFLCDGRYFVDRYLNHFGGVAAARTPGKRGPTKCPDFICWQPAGSFHVVECKGTQSGNTTHANQIASAQVQKTTVNFPASRQGEKLACGMKIELEGSGRRSELFVTDPDYKVVLSVDEERLPFANDIMWRGFTARALSASGLSSTALALSEPDTGEIASRRPKTSKIKKEEYVNIDKNRIENSKNELNAFKGKSLFRNGGNNYTGREHLFDLPLPIIFGDGKVSSRVMVRQGVNTNIINDMNPENFKDIRSNEISDNQQFTSETQSSISSISFGNIFRSEIAFL